MIALAYSCILLIVLNSVNDVVLFMIRMIRTNKLKILVLKVKSMFVNSA